jgi:hypothetical protein
MKWSLAEVVVQVAAKLPVVESTRNSAKLRLLLLTSEVKLVPTVIVPFPEVSTVQPKRLSAEFEVVTEPLETAFELFPGGFCA